jgi:hypothetical protein
LEWGRALRGAGAVPCQATGEPPTSDSDVISKEEGRARNHVTKGKGCARPLEVMVSKGPEGSTARLQESSGPLVMVSAKQRTELNARLRCPAR